jgi:chromosomal replication initiator protein
MYNLRDDNNSYALSLWQSAVVSLKDTYGEITYKNWFSHLAVISLDNGIMTFSAPSRFIREWICNNYLDYIKSVLELLDPSISAISIEVVESTQLQQRVDSIVQTKEHAINCDIFSYPLDERLNFENFAVGDANRIAFSACTMVAKNEKSIAGTNIIYMHSAVGMGKTHLLQAVASHIRANSSDQRSVLYLSAEKFMHLYLKYLRANDLIGFKEKLKSSDILLLDDLQFICGKAATSQEFSNILTALSDANKCVVISSDTSPFKLALDQRAKSRLVGGLVIEIEPADYALKVAILKKKCIQMGQQISEDVLALIAEKVLSSNRELEGALTKLITFASLSGQDPNLELANRILKENFASSDVALTPESILDHVANYFAVEVTEIKSKSRAAGTVLPRQVAAYLLKTLTTKSLQEIGKMLGGRDHASVIYYCKQITAKLMSDSKVILAIDEIKAKIA